MRFISNFAAVLAVFSAVQALPTPQEVVTPQKLETRAASKLYVGNLPNNFGDNDLLSIFSHYGATGAKVQTEAHTARPKGFGFVNFGSEANARAAMQALNGKSVGGRQLAVKSA